MKQIISAMVLLVMTYVGYTGTESLGIVSHNQQLEQAIGQIAQESVVLNEVVPFAWDTVYTFDPYTPRLDMEHVIGFSSNALKESVSEGMVQLVFVQGKRVVSSICSYADVLGYAISFNERVDYHDCAVFGVHKNAGITVLTLQSRN